jgi:hypothetical protein
MLPTVRGRVITAFAIASLLLLWGGGFAQASTRNYSVTYTGSGHFTSDTESEVSPQCGDVIVTRDEDTHFSWIDQWHLSLRVGDSSVGSGSATDKAKSIEGDNNDSTVTLDGSGDGCQDGTASCHGESEPDPGWDTDLKVQGGRLTAEALFGPKGWTADDDWSGTWADPDSVLAFGADSCDAYLEDSDELLIPLIQVPDEFKASFPVKAATWKSLKPGHYFKVKISEGHYTPELPFYDRCEADDGCNSQDLSFNGTVKVTRLG